MAAAAPDQPVAQGDPKPGGVVRDFIENNVGGSGGRTRAAALAALDELEGKLAGEHDLSEWSHARALEQATDAGLFERKVASLLARVEAAEAQLAQATEALREIAAEPCERTQEYFPDAPCRDAKIARDYWCASCIALARLKQGDKDA